jgi:hypothetical protein
MGELASFITCTAFAEEPYPVLLSHRDLVMGQDNKVNKGKPRAVPLRVPHSYRNSFWPHIRALNTTKKRPAHQGGVIHCDLSLVTAIQEPEGKLGVNCRVRDSPLWRVLATRGKPACLVVVVPGVSKDLQDVNILMMSRGNVRRENNRVAASHEVKCRAQESARVQLQERAIGIQLHDHARVFHVKLMVRVKVRVVSDLAHWASKPRK